jgi:hypothetical protein
MFDSASSCTLLTLDWGICGYLVGIRGEAVQLGRGTQGGHTCEDSPTSLPSPSPNVLVQPANLGYKWMMKHPLSLIFIITTYFYNNLAPPSRFSHPTYHSVKDCATCHVFHAPQLFAASTCHSFYGKIYVLKFLIAETHRLWVSGRTVCQPPGVNSA